MLSKPVASRVIVSASRAAKANKRQFSASSSLRAAAKNRIYTSVRTPDEFHTLNLLSSSSNRPLITLWTSRTCSSCQFVAPLVQGLIENDGVGEKEGGLGYAEIEMDSTLIEDLPFQLMVCHLGLRKSDIHLQTWSDQLHSDVASL